MSERMAETILLLSIALVLSSCSGKSEKRSLTRNKSTRAVHDHDFAVCDTLRAGLIFKGDTENNIYMNMAGDIKYNPFDKRMYAVDPKENNIKMFDINFIFIEEFGRYGQGPGELMGPFGIAFSDDGTIYVNETQNSRIQLFDSQLNHINSVSFDYSIPYHNFAVDAEGLLYVPFKDASDPASPNLIQIIDKDGTRLNHFGSKLPYEGYPPDVHGRINLLSLTAINDEIFCCFNHRPVVRKYNKNYDIVFELDLSELHDAKRYHSYLKRADVTNVVPTYFSFIEVDEQYLYVSMLTNFNYETSLGKHKTFYVFDKDTGDPISKKCIVISEDSVYEFILSFNARHPDYYFLSEQYLGYLVRIPKNS